MDTKKFKLHVNVVADDKSIEKKDKTVGEPVQFYVRGARAPYEIVVFRTYQRHGKGLLEYAEVGDGSCSISYTTGQLSQLTSRHWF